MVSCNPSQSWTVKDSHLSLSQKLHKIQYRQAMSCHALSCLASSAVSISLICYASYRLSIARWESNFFQIVVILLVNISENIFWNAAMRRNASTTVRGIFAAFWGRMLGCGRHVLLLPYILYSCFLFLVRVFPDTELPRSSCIRFIVVFFDFKWKIKSIYFN